MAPKPKRRRRRKFVAVEPSIAQIRRAAARLLELASAYECAVDDGAEGRSRLDDPHAARALNAVVATMEKFEEELQARREQAETAAIAKLLMRFYRHHRGAEAVSNVELARLKKRLERIFPDGYVDTWLRAVAEDAIGHVHDDAHHRPAVDMAARMAGVSRRTVFNHMEWEPTTLVRVEAGFGYAPTNYSSLRYALVALGCPDDKAHAIAAAAAPSNIPTVTPEDEAKLLAAIDGDTVTEDAPE